MLAVLEPVEPGADIVQGLLHVARLPVLLQLLCPGAHRHVEQALMAAGPETLEDARSPALVRCEVLLQLPLDPPDLPGQRPVLLCVLQGLGPGDEARVQRAHHGVRAHARHHLGHVCPPGVLGLLHALPHLLQLIRGDAVILRFLPKQDPFAEGLAQQHAGDVHGLALERRADVVQLPLLQLEKPLLGLSNLSLPLHPDILLRLCLHQDAMPRGKGRVEHGLVLAPGEAHEAGPGLLGLRRAKLRKLRLGRHPLLPGTLRVIRGLGKPHDPVLRPLSPASVRVDGPCDLIRGAQHRTAENLSRDAHLIVNLAH
mmetsp:Transcript_108682/g.325072  ORF Transcript_108682/g.325072 Transcript_108682/m.325072 type:complete len:313 (+) Transcript_108682:497-1435(+)